MEQEEIPGLPENIGQGWVSHFFNEAFNICGALTIILIGSPIFVVVALLLWWREGRPVFYHGKRLGKDKTQFEMYKFRTLITDAERQLQGELLGSRQELITPTGKFLRDTRLDELPQLFNVLRRDMNLVGPRPVRPEVYKVKCQNIPNYDQRFVVRPGLVGFSQVFTPHSAPKEIRTLIDNRLIRNHESVWWNIQVLTVTAILIAQEIVERLFSMLRERVVRQMIMKEYQEKRRFERFDTSNATCYISLKGNNNFALKVDEIVDINVEAFLLRSRQNLESRFPATLRIEIKVRRLGRGPWKVKTAWCTGEIYRKSQREDGRYEYVIRYAPTSPLNKYKIHQYFLHESIGS